MINFPLLTSEDIEVKVKQITKSGALLLLYKTARVDAKILDEAVGPMNWCCSYREVKGNLFCSVGIREKEDSDFVYKEDCGIESGQDDGNEKKAEASDAFKRACSRLGIGRELYTSPVIWADVATVQKNDKWVLQDPFAKYVVTHIAFNEDTRVITELEITNAKSNIKVFTWKLSSEGAIGRKMVKTWAPEEAEKTEPVAEAKEEVKPAEPEESKPQEKPKRKTTSKTASDAASSPVETVSPSNEGKHTSEEQMPLKELITSIGRMVKEMFVKEGNRDLYKEIITEVTGNPDFKCNTATDAEYDKVAGIYTALVEAGYGDA